MPTVCLRFRFRENGKVAVLLEACRAIHWGPHAMLTSRGVPEQQAIDFAWENNKTATLRSFLEKANR
jgi:hypothetical protein